MGDIAARFRLERRGFTLDVDLTLPPKGVTALFGHSGSGKTTLLRCIAGLERTPGGYLSIDGEIWQNRNHWLPPHKRPLGYVFQDASLFPHLSVLGNLRFGTNRVKASQRIDLDHAIELLGIAHLLDRQPDSLSGGERQRVAIARALAVSPRVLLMDEPLAALDLKRKKEIIPYIERLHDELEIPVIYVSHSPDELARLADHLVLMDNGAVLTAGPLQETLARLDLPHILADDAGVVLDTVVAEHDDNALLTRLDFPGGSIRVARRPEARGRRLRCRVDARDISLALHRADQTSILNILPATVLALAGTDSPAHVLVRLQMNGTPLLARITRYSRDQLGLHAGLEVWAQIKAVALLD